MKRGTPLFIRSALWASVMLASAIAHGQDSACNGLLTHGIYDTLEFSGREMEEYRVYKYVCNESRKGIESGATAGIEIGFRQFSLGGRRHVSTAVEYHQKYCDESEDEVLGNTSYSLTIKKINEKALASWNACVDSLARGIEIYPDVSMDETRVRFELRRTMGDGHALRGIDSRIFECRKGASEIDEGGLDGIAPIEIGGDALNFTCTRIGQLIEHSASTYYAGGDIVLDLSTGQFVLDFGERMTGPLSQRIRALEQKLREIGRSAPTDRVVSFAQATCPAGWTEYEPAYGRFIRGVDRGPEKTDPDGERNIGSYQESMIGDHRHRFFAFTRVHRPSADRGGDHGDLWQGQRRQNYDTESNPSGETRPSNVALLYCRYVGDEAEE